MSWSDVPEADALEQQQDVFEDDDDPELSPASPDSVPVSLEASPEDVFEQHQVVPSDEEDWPA